MAEINYIFTEDISNSPLYPNITRKISFNSHTEYELNNRQIIKTELVIRHFDSIEIPELNRSIILVTDGSGLLYPIGLDIDLNDDIIGLDSTPLITDLEWFINWLQNDKGMLSMFKLISKLHNIIKYDTNGNDVGINSPDAKYTYFDCKYLKIFS
jgi:hypothetical protein